jgi:hypothetical protein
MSVEEISQGATSSGESVQAAVNQSIEALNSINESLSTLMGLSGGTQASEMSTAASLMAEAAAHLGDVAMMLQTYPGTINPWLINSVGAEPISEINVPEAKTVKPEDPSKYTLDPPEQPEPRENELLADESYDAFGVRVVELDDPNVLYIEVDGGMVSGEITTDENGVTVATVDIVSVQSGRKQGKGKYLMDAFAREAALRGAQQLDSTFTNPIAMRNHIRTFGTDRLQPQGDDYAQLDKNSPDYAARLAEDAGSKTIDVRVDLTDPEARKRLFKK